MRTNNTTLQAHSGKLEYERTIYSGKQHKILVYTIAGTNTFVYVPVFLQNGIWYSYAVDGQGFATFVYVNALSKVAGKK